jgi:hypothetical protein
MYSITILVGLVIGFVVGGGLGYFMSARYSFSQVVDTNVYKAGRYDAKEQIT